MARPGAPQAGDGDRGRGHAQAATSSKPNCAERVSELVVGTLEGFFFRLGLAVGLYPGRFAIGCVIFSFLCGAGAYRFYEESRPGELFVPRGVQVLEDADWVVEHFPGRNRFENVIVTADDILQPEVIQAIFAIDDALKGIESTNPQYSWESLCYRLGPVCWSNSILELWSFDGTTIANLTRQDILDAVNAATVSPVTSHPFILANYLGGVMRDNSGQVVGAKASYMQYVLFNNDTDTVGGPYTLLGLAFEEEFLAIAAQTREMHLGVLNDVTYYTSRSRQDEGGSAIQKDLLYFIGGYLLLIAFVTFVLGQFNLVYQRIWATLGGIACVLLAILVAIGLASWIGIFYGPLHSVLPFLVLGLGVDDMFIITQALDSLDPELQKSPVHIRMAHALKHAGVSITVTSLTDILAFGVGATTAIPALSSFCIYVCIAILAVYVFQSTLFVAVLTWDERRAQQFRDACCCCFTHRLDYQPSEFSQTSYMQLVFDRAVAFVLQNTVAKVHVILVTFVLLAGCIVGVCFLKQDFDDKWFIPGDSYAAAYIRDQEMYFPADGLPTKMYIGDIDYFGQFSAARDLCSAIEDDPFVQNGTVDCWPAVYSAWLNTTDNSPDTDADGFPLDAGKFYTILQTFLASSTGRRYTSNTFQFNGTYYIEACAIPLKHENQEDATAEIRAMDSLRALGQQSGLGAFPYAFRYGVWEGNRVIREELFRNLGLALLCVFLMTLVLLANLWACLLILTCVLFTLIDVGGLLYFWGLTIDLVTSINLIIAVGLAVDYSAHIALGFMTVKGSKNDRMRRTMGLVGPPVFYGGLSTFLAFVLLANSASYVFSVFFKIFLGVTLFGLFHGLVYLPVLLSWIGPQPYYNAREEQITGDGKATRYPMYVAGRPSLDRRRRVESEQQKADVYQISMADNQAPFSHGVPVDDRQWQLPRPKMITTRAQVSNYQPSGGMFTGKYYRGPYRHEGNSHSMPPKSRNGRYRKYQAPAPPSHPTTYPRYQDHGRQLSRVPQPPPPPPPPPHVAGYPSPWR